MKAKSDVEKEAVLSTLEQLSQTMDAMNRVIDRLKQRVESVQAQSPTLDLEDDLPLPEEEITVH